MLFWGKVQRSDLAADVLQGSLGREGSTGFVLWVISRAPKDEDGFFQTPSFT